MMSQKEYLGDGVYAEVNDIPELILTTEDGISTTNTIYMETEVVMALLSYIDRLCPKTTIV
jgi:hypothetical protein